MPHMETPADKGGRCDKLAGGSQHLNTIAALQTQFLTARCRVRPALAQSIAALAWGSA